jgi:LacI family transcriptional regulator
LLVVAPGGKDVAHIQDAIKAGIPIVCLDRVPPGIDVDSVSVDNIGGSRHCIEHLLLEGHRKIAIITGPAGIQTANERLRGYTEALKKAGIMLAQELIRAVPDRIGTVSRTGPANGHLCFQQHHGAGRFEGG